MENINSNLDESHREITLDGFHRTRKDDISEF